MTYVREALHEFEQIPMPDLWAAIEARRLRAETVPTRRRESPRFSWRTVTAVAAVTVALALVVPVVLPRGSGGADPAAAAMLRGVARRAAAQPAQPAPGPGQFLYTETTSVQTYVYVTGSSVPNFTFTQPLTRKSWIGTDGSGRLLVTGGDVSFPTDGDRAAWVAAGSPSLDQAEGDQAFGAGQLVYQDVTDLPTDPDALLRLIETRTIVDGPKGDWETFEIVGDLLRETYTVPAVRGALFEVAADLPGVEYVGNTTDSIGRPGVAVAYTHEGVRKELIFDPDTAELLGERMVLTEDSRIDVDSGGKGAVYGDVGSAGTLAYDAAYVASRVVESTDTSR